MRKYIVFALVLCITGSPITAFSGQIPAAPAAPKLKNVELSDAGELQGQLVTSTGFAVANTAVRLSIGDKNWSAQTDSSGAFVLKGLHGGRGVLFVADETFACQLWSHGTAPPNSIRSIALVASADSEVRGQLFGAGRRFSPAARIASLSKKQLIGLGLIIAGTTVGIAAAASDDDAS